MSTSRDTSSKPSAAILVACRPIKQVEIRYGRWGMTRGRTKHDKTVRWRQRTPRRSYGEHGESHGENHDKIATTNRASIRARNVMQISPCVFPWLRSHLVEVLLDSCLGASLRIEDGEVSQTLPLKVLQGARKLLWMSAGAMNDTSKLCRLQAMGLICLMGLGMSLCTKLSADVICPHKRQKSKNFCHDQLLGNRWDNWLRSLNTSDWRLAIWPI